MALTDRPRSISKYSVSSPPCILVALVLAGTVGCALQSDQNNLEKRVAALEVKQKASDERQKTRDDAQSTRLEQLEGCVKYDADDVYWNYIKLNGTAVPGHPGQYRAPQSDWDHAERIKRDKIEECKLLYGPR
jgi:hypothetical protein